MNAAPPAPERPRPGTRRWVPRALAALTVGGLVAVAVWAAWLDSSGVGEDGTEGTAPTPIRVASQWFQDAVRKETLEPWGLDVHVQFPGANGTVRFLQDPPLLAVELHIRLTLDNGSLDADWRQVGNVTNLIVHNANPDLQAYAGNGSFYGRDEDPTTRYTFARILNERRLGFGVTDVVSRFNFQDLPPNSELESTTHRGHPALRLRGEDDNGPFDAVYYTDLERPARFQIGEHGYGLVLDFFYGDEVDIQVATHPPLVRMPFQLASERRDQVTYRVTDDQLQEVRLSEVEMRAIDAASPANASGPVVASMRLDEGGAMRAGVAFGYGDVDGDGLVSEGDAYTFDPGASGTRLLMYDLWAADVEGGPIRVSAGVPGFGFALALMGFLGILALRKRGA